MKNDSNLAAILVGVSVLGLAACAPVSEAVMPDYQSTYTGRQRVQGAEQVTIVIARPVVDIAVKSNTLTFGSTKQVGTGFGLGPLYIDEPSKSNAALQQAYQQEISKILSTQGFRIISVTEDSSLVYEDKVRAALMLVAKISMDGSVDPYKKSNASGEGNSESDKSDKNNAVVAISPIIQLTLIEPLSGETHWSKTLRPGKSAESFYSSTASTGRVVAAVLTGVYTGSWTADNTNLHNASMAVINRLYPATIKIIGDSLAGQEIIHLVPGAMKTKSLRRY